MKIILHSPAATVRRTGNRQTSNEWARFLREAGHEVHVTGSYRGQPADLLIALHAVKSRGAVLTFREAVPAGKVILALTGTDIYPEPTAEALDTMTRADGLITLQRKAVEQVPHPLRDRVTTVIQSAERLAEPGPARENGFPVCVVGHLREVKDPLLAARAASQLPAESRVRVLQAGGILESAFADAVSREEADNPRYHWLGELSERETAQVIADSRLLIVTSKSEGGARVVGEAIVHGTPVLSTRIEGVEGLLGPDYPGFFPVGDAAALAALLARCESEEAYYQTLQESCRAAKDQFSPEREAASLLDAVSRTGPLT